jgi:cytochrome c5
MLEAVGGKVVGPARQPRKGRRVSAAASLALALCLAPATGFAQTRERSGKDVVDALCVACHGTGAKGAPKIGDEKAWAKRSAQGLTGLTKNALEGIRQMPPHGGNPGLTDTEIERAITYMVNQSGGHWAEPINRSAPPPDRSGEQIVRERCAKCHRTGEGGAPRIGDQAAWIPRLKQGLDVVVRSAIKGHGGMPSRGGQADLTDAELRAAVVYMVNPASAAAKPAAGPAGKAAAGQDYQIVDGTTVRFGVIPATAIRRDRTEYPEKVYGAVPDAPDQYYVTIALFDDKGKRIADATARARVSTAAGAGPEKTLEPVTVSGARTYGNYFAMGGTGPFEVAVRIRRPGNPDTTEVRFEYSPR